MNQPERACSEVLEIFLNGYIVWGHAAAKFLDDQIDSDGALQGY